MYRSSKITQFPCKLARDALSARVTLSALNLLKQVLTAQLITEGDVLAPEKGDTVALDLILIYPREKLIIIQLIWRHENDTCSNSVASTASPCAHTEPPAYPASDFRGARDPVLSLSWDGAWTSQTGEKSCKTNKYV